MTWPASSSRWARSGADPVYLANVRFLAGYRRPWAVPPAAADSVLARWGPGDTISERTIRQLLTSAGLRQPATLPGAGIDPQWLSEQYQDRQRSLKDIAAETGVPVEALAATARNAGIRIRHGVASRAHLLAALGGPNSFSADVWNVFARPGAEQRIWRLLALLGQPSLNAAARQLGIRNANLASQVRQLEAVVGTPILRTGPDGRLALTAYGKRFARDVTPVLKMLSANGQAPSRSALISIARQPQS